MTTFGYLTVIKRNGLDGSKLPLKTSSCLIGRDEECDIRIQLPNVSQNHCRIDVLPSGEILLINLSDANPTVTNGGKVKTSIMLGHGDVFTISDRSFRWDFLASSPYYIEKRRLSLRNGVPLAQSSLGKTRPSIEKKMKKKSPTPNKTPSTISPAKKKRRLSASTLLSLKKVSFGPTLSPEQYEVSSPVSTPIKKGGRPPSRRPSLPSYYGNPILTPVRTVMRSSSGNRSLSNDSSMRTRSPKGISTSPGDENVDSNTPDIKKSPLKNLKSSSAKMKATFGGKRKSRSMSTAAGRSGKKKNNISISGSSPSKKSSVRMLLGLENAVKIVAPASPDSKKSAALRTIHAGKLKLKRSKSAQFLMKRKKNAVRRHSLKVQIPFSRASPTKETKVVGKRSTSLDNRRNSKTSPPSDEYKSPNISKEVFVSPLNTPSNELKFSAIKRFIRKSGKRGSRRPENDSMNLSGIETLMQTPSPQKMTPGRKMREKSRSYEKKTSTDVAGLKRVRRTTRNSLKPDYSDVRDIKRLMRSPQKSPKSDYSDVRGVKRLMKSPARSPKSEYVDVFGLKRLMRTPHVSPTADYTDVKGVKRIMKTPRKSFEANYTGVEGVKRLFRRSKSFRLSDGNSSKKSLPVEMTPKTETPTSTSEERGSENILGSVGRVTRSIDNTPIRTTAINSNVATPKLVTPSVLKKKSPSPTSKNLPKTSPPPATGLSNTRGSLGRSPRSASKRSPSVDDVRDMESPAKKKTTPKVTERLARSENRSSKRIANAKTPKSVTRTRGKKRSTSPAVVEMKSLSPSPTKKSPLLTPSKGTHQTNTTNAEAPVKLTVTPKKMRGRPSKKRSPSSNSVKDVESPTNKTPRMKMTPEFVKRVTRSAKKTKFSPKVTTPKSVTRKLGKTSPTVIAISPNPTVKTPLLSSTTNTAGQKKKLQTSPIELSDSPMITPQSTKVSRKTAKKSDTKTPVTVVTSTRTRSKRVEFIDDDWKPAITPKSTKGKRGTPKKSESKSSPVNNTPSPVLSKRKTRGAVKKTSPKPKKAAEKISPKVESPKVHSRKTKKTLVQSPKTTSSNISSPKALKIRSPVVTRTSLRRKK